MNRPVINAQHVQAATDVQQILFGLDTALRVKKYLDQRGYVDPSERAVIMRIAFILMMLSELRLTEIALTGGANETRLSAVRDAIAEVLNNHLATVYGQATGESN